MFGFVVVFKYNHENKSNKLENNRVHTQGDQDGSVNEGACHTEPTHKKVDGWNQPHEVDL